jgi:Ca-activated chloride channel family protein
MTFSHPWLLLLWAVLPLAGLFWVRARSVLRPGLGHSAPPGVRRIEGLRGWLERGLPLLRALALAVLIFALAGPQLGSTKVRRQTEGVDIVLALDISGSMRALDFAPGSRLDAAKEVARQFVEGRRGDRIGLVVFASNSYTQCPLTTDYAVLQQLLDQVRIGDIADGTAIGMAIGNALNRLRDAPGQSRVIILLTDGMNNTGVLDPATAAQLARDLKVRIHTIGAGSKGRVPYPFEDPRGGEVVRMIEVDMDEASLQSIAETTGGLYFRATDRESLLRIYERIDALEKTRVETEEYVEYREIGPYLLWPALLLLALELGLGLSWLRRLP